MQSEKNPVTLRKNTLSNCDTCRKMAYFIKATTQSCKSYVTVFHTFFCVYLPCLRKILQWEKDINILSSYRLHIIIWPGEEKHLYDDVCVVCQRFHLKASLYNRRPDFSLSYFQITNSYDLILSQSDNPLVA